MRASRHHFGKASLVLATIAGAGLTALACTSEGPADDAAPATSAGEETTRTVSEGLVLGANVFVDNFDGGSLNRGNWNVQTSVVNDACTSSGTPFNGEVQRYQDREGCALNDHNICVSNGTLKLVVRRQDGTSCNGSYAKYTSARINSKRKREFNPNTGGAGVRVEAKIRMPAGIAGGWPAFWTLGNDIKQGPRQWNGSDDNDWPDSGEIDIAEAGWNWGGGSTSLNTLHYSSNNWSAWDGDGHQQRSAGSTGIGRYEWHTYAVEWTPSSMTWFKDGGVTGSTSLNFGGQDFEHDHFMLLNLAMGGAGGGTANAADSYFPKNGATYMWEQVMEVDYVRVDKLENGSTCTPTTCAAQGKNCGSISNGCGGTLSCGNCTSPQTCGGGGTANVCGGGSCTPTTCAAQGKNCGSISNGCGGTLSCGNCTSPQTCGGGGTANVCGGGGERRLRAAPRSRATRLGKCNATAVYNGKLYKCISQAAGVNGSTQCGTAGVYCSSIPPTDAAWGTTAWQFVQNCQ